MTRCEGTRWGRPCGRVLAPWEDYTLRVEANGRQYRWRLCRGCLRRLLGHRLYRRVGWGAKP